MPNLVRYCRMLLCAALVLGPGGHLARAADYPLYVRYLPYSPPGLYVRTSRATAAYYVSIGAANTWTFDLDPVVAGTLSLAEGPVPVTIGVYRVPSNCSGAKTVTVSVHYNIGGAFTTVGSETQVINVPNNGNIVPLFNFNNIASASSYVLQTGDYVRINIGTTSNRLCLVNEFPTGGTDTDASRAVLQTGPMINVTKSSAVYSDPINGTTNPKAIPGAIMRYTVLVENDAAASANGENVIVDDPIPTDTTYSTASMTLDTGGGPVALTDAADADAGSFTGTNISINAGTIAPGSSATVTFDVVVD